MFYKKLSGLCKGYKESDKCPSNWFGFLYKILTYSVAKTIGNAPTPGYKDKIVFLEL